MNYLEICFCLSESAGDYLADLLKNELLSLGFESFMDNDDGSFCGYITKRDFDEKKLKNLLSCSDFFNKDMVGYNIRELEDRNWNEKWEENSPSVLFGNFCHIRKETQPYKEVRYDIIINPKQSFGTANHPTTAMIIEYLRSIEKDIKGKNVLDMGCGTAVLGILCKKMGAEYVQAIDIDDWAYRNAKENALKNDLDMDIRMGSSEAINKNVKFDIILANINLNCLLENMIYFVDCLKDNGFLILSGFYENDIKELVEKTKRYNLTFYYKSVKQSWALVVLKG